MRKFSLVLALTFGCNTPPKDLDSGYPNATDADADADADGEPPGPVDADDDGFTEDVDCDDSNPNVYPEAAEVCDDIDNDCDDEIDEDAIDMATWFGDNDGDGYGNPDEGAWLDACDMPEGYTDASMATDCDDLDQWIYPGADEFCDDIDNDCDDEIDEGLECYTPGDISFSHTSSVDTWTVPMGVSSVEIEVQGAVGGSGTTSGLGGKGARMSGTFAVSAGMELSVYAGGNDGIQAGGDCSYVADGDTALVVAGGGGGGGYSYTGNDAPVTEDGTEPIPGSYTHGTAGTSGSGGGAGTGDWGTGGGGGWLSAGADGGVDGGGSMGGEARCMGSAGSTYAGGAGGGYSGGGGTAMHSGWGTIAGGSGGSYSVGTDQDNEAGFNNEGGSVTIAW